MITKMKKYFWGISYHLPDIERYGECQLKVAKEQNQVGGHSVG